MSKKKIFMQLRVGRVRLGSGKKASGETFVVVETFKDQNKKSVALCARGGK